MLEGELNQKQIASELKVTQQTVTTWKKDERFQELKFQMEKEVLKNLTGKALKTLKELLNAESETVKYYASRDILDRAGHKQTDKLEVKSESNVVVNNPFEDLNVDELKKFINKVDDKDEDK